MGVEWTLQLMYDGTKTMIFFAFKLVQGLRWRTQLKVGEAGHVLFGVKCRTLSL